VGCCAVLGCHDKLKYLLISGGIDAETQDFPIPTIDIIRVREPTQTSPYLTGLYMPRDEQDAEDNGGRARHCSVIHGSRLFIVGGENYLGQGLTSVVSVDIPDAIEYLESHMPQDEAVDMAALWQHHDSMRYARVEFAAAVCGEYLYVTGGRDGWDGMDETDIAGSDCMSITEVFDFALNKWSEVSPMSLGRSQHGMAAVGGKVMVAGGIGNRMQPLNSTEVFDPETGVWSSVAALCTPFEMARLVVLGDPNLVYAVGRTITEEDMEEDPDEGGDQGFEVYDVSRNRWTPVIRPHRDAMWEEEDDEEEQPSSEQQVESGYAALAW